jgi:hypothetical protein
MADTVSTQKIVIDTSQAQQTIEDVTRQFVSMSDYAKQASEGIENVGGEYKFANAELQKWYETLKSFGLAHNKMTVDIINDMQNAAKASQLAAQAQGEHAKVIKEGVLSATQELHHQKLAFEDIGRLALGEKFGLRQFAQLFGVLGPAVGIAAFAISEYGGELLKMIDRQEDANRQLEEFNKVMVNSSDATAQATINVEKMNAEFQNSTSIKDRNKALDDYNKTFGEIIGYQDSFEKAEKNLADKTEIYKLAMQQRAIADAAYALQKEKIKEALNAQINGESGFFAKIKAGIQGYLGDFTGVAGTLGASNKKIVDEFNDDADSLAKAADRAEKKFKELKDQAGGGTGKPRDKKKPGKDSSLEEQKRYIEESRKIMEDAEDKEITNENIKYEKIRENLIKNHHSTEELDAQHEQNVADIHTKYAEKLAAEIKKEIQKANDDALKLTAEGERAMEKAKQDAIAKKKKDDEELRKADQKFLQDRFSDMRIEISTLKNHYATKRQLLIEDQKIVKAMYDKGSISYEEYQKKNAEIGQAGLEIKKQQAAEEKMIAEAAATTLDTLSKLAGEHTAAGKAFAVAGATIKAIQAGINTFEGFTSEFPGPVGIALGAVAAAGVGLTLFEQVKKIEEVKIPGQAGGGTTTSNGSVNAPTIPKSPKTTSLSQNSINQIKPNQKVQPTRAIVVEADITNSQARLASYHESSSLH